MQNQYLSRARITSASSVMHFLDYLIILLFSSEGLSYCYTQSLRDFRRLKKRQFKFFEMITTTLGFINVYLTTHLFFVFPSLHVRPCSPPLSFASPLFSSFCTLSLFLSPAQIHNLLTLHFQTLQWACRLQPRVM